MNNYLILQDAYEVLLSLIHMNLYASYINMCTTI
jgi:hypothetical protein